MKRIRHLSFIIILLMLFLMPLITLLNQNHLIKNEKSEFELTKKAAYILITNNGELAANASGGYGNWTHPYIIENYTIDMTTISTNAISISGTTDYFIIRNCTIFNGPLSYPAILLNGVTNGLIYNNNLTSNVNSIYFYSSSNCNATENTCHLGTTSSAIMLYQSNNIRIINNTFTNNSRGVTIADSDDNLIINNTALYSLDSGIAIDNPSGSSTNNNVINNNCSFGLHGIQFLGSSTYGNHIINNTIYNNSQAGIYLRTSSEYNNITNNTVINNQQSGIECYTSRYNKLSNNTVINNGYAGIFISSANNNSVEFNRLSKNNRGIEISSNSDNSTILNNTVFENENDGIYISYSKFNKIINNTVFNQNGSFDTGIYLTNSINNSIQTNLVFDNYYGIELYFDSDNNSISNNMISYSQDDGLTLYQSDDNNISYNTFEGNSNDIYEASSSGNVFIGNTFKPATPVLYSFPPDPDNDGSIYVDWSSVNGATKYYVYRNTSIISYADDDLIIFETSLSYYTDTISANGTYYYAVVAESSSNSSLSNCENVTIVLFAPQTPPILEKITPDSDTYGNFYLNWSSVENATRYYIYNNTSEIATVVGMEPLLITVNTEYTHMIPINITYHYVIVAGNDYGNSSISNCENVTVLLIAPQEPPNLESFNPNPDYFGNVNVNWSMVENATEYHIYRNTSYINTPDEQLRIVTVTDTNYTDVLTQNGTYYYAVVAANAFGNSSLSNCESVKVQVTPNTTILEEITPDPDTDGTITLNWSDVINADMYYIYRNTSTILSISGLQPIDTVTTSNYTDYLFENLQYYYVIVAGNSFANSSISNCENVTIQLPLNATSLDLVIPNPSTNGSIILNWSVVPNADFYLIFRDINNITSIIGLIQLDNVTTTNYTDNITTNGIYYYVIIAGNFNGNSSLSNCVNVTVQIPSNNQPDPPIPGFELIYIILGLICIASIAYLITQKRPKSYSKFI